MRILHVAETIEGGVASHLEEILPLQIERYGPDSCLLIAPADQRQHLPSLPDKNYSAYTAKPSRLGSTLALVQAIRKVRPAFQPDIMHSHSTFAGIAARAPLIFSGNRPRQVYCPHGWAFAMNSSAPVKRAYATIEHGLALSTDAIINVSHHEYELARSFGLPDRPMAVVRNGLSDIAPSQEPAPVPIDPSVMNLLFVGRLTEQKGIDILLAAARSVQDLPIRFHVVGKAYRDYQLADGSVPDNVTMHGWLDRAQIPAMLAACDALLLPSRWEGLPMIGLEAMRAGKAIIASDRSALPELFAVPNTSGMLVSIDDPQDYARALRSLSKEALAIMGAEARRRFLANFTADRQEAELAKIYTRHPSGD